MADVAYDTPCPGGGSEFSPYFLEKEMGGQPLKVLVLSRSEPKCDDAPKGADGQRWRGTVKVPLPDDVRTPFLMQRFSFIAFPPGAFERGAERAGKCRKWRQTCMRRALTWICANAHACPLAHFFLRVAYCLLSMLRRTHRGWIESCKTRRRRVRGHAGRRGSRAHD